MNAILKLHGVAPIVSSKGVAYFLPRYEIRRVIAKTVNQRINTLDF